MTDATLTAPARLRIFRDAAHGFLFQYPIEFAVLVNGFLDT